MRTTSIDVRLPASCGRDAYGDEISCLGEPIRVPGVLLVPGDASDMGSAGRPDGITRSITAHFPKSWSGRSLRGAVADLPEPYGEGWAVIGDPIPYMPENTPTPWNMPVRLEKTDG